MYAVAEIRSWRLEDGEVAQSAQPDQSFILSAGRIPSTLGELTALSVLRLDMNKLDGETCGRRVVYPGLGFAVHVRSAAGSRGGRLGRKPLVDAPVRAQQGQCTR